MPDLRVDELRYVHERVARQQSRFAMRSQPDRLVARSATGSRNNLDCECVACHHGGCSRHEVQEAMVSQWCQHKFRHGTVRRPLHRRLLGRLQ